MATLVPSPPMQQHFSTARIHRDLQHVKKNIKNNKGKLSDPNLLDYIIDVAEFSAKLSSRTSFTPPGRILWVGFVMRQKDSGL